NLRLGGRASVLRNGDGAIDRNADDVALPGQIVRTDAEHFSDLVGLRGRNHGGRLDRATDRCDEANRADEEGDPKTAWRAEGSSRRTPARSEDHSSSSRPRPPMRIEDRQGDRGGTSLLRRKAAARRQ